MKRFPLSFVAAAFFTLLLLSVASAPPAQAQKAQQADQAPDAIVEVDGLACPFCAYGLEKKLRKVEGVKSLNVKIEAGEIEIAFEDGQTVEKEPIRQAVAGFTVREITYP